MELFTVDTAGDQDLLHADHVESTETEYFAKEFRVENTDEINRSDGEDDEGDNVYDYGGECRFHSIAVCPVIFCRIKRNFNFSSQGYPHLR